MAKLVVDARKRITLNEDLLRHLVVQPGGKVEIMELPHGRIEIRAARPAGRISDAFGMLNRKDGRALTVAQINRIATRGWAGRR